MDFCKSDDEDNRFPDSSSSETDTIISQDLLQMMGEDNKWVHENSKEPSPYTIRSSSTDYGEELYFAGANRKNFVARQASGVRDSRLLSDARPIPNEMEALKRQLTQYKIRVRALTEILKQVNLNTDESRQFPAKTLDKGKCAMNEDGTGGLSRMGGLQTSDMHHSLQDSGESNQKLKGVLEEKNKELIKLKEELIRNKSDYETMLEEVNDYLQHNETISNNINEILKYLLENMELTPEEHDNLHKAASFESTFIDIKIKALSVNVDKIVQDLRHAKHSSEEGAEITVASNNSQYDGEINVSEILDTKLELAIETMHEKYHDFLQSIQLKLEKNSTLESTLKEKLRMQKGLLESIAALDFENEQTVSEPALYLQKSHSSLFSSIDDLSKRASMELSKSYQDHVDALNNMLQSYKKELEDKDKQIVKLASI